MFANGKLTDWWTTHFIVAEGDDRSASKTQRPLQRPLRYRQPPVHRGRTISRWPRSKNCSVGYEHLDQSLDSDTFAAPTRHVDSVFAGYTARFGRNQIQANVRRDQYSDFGGANSYYLGYGFDITRIGS